MQILQDLQSTLLDYFSRLADVWPKLAIAIIVVSVLSFVLRFIRVKAIKFLHKRADDKLLVKFADSLVRLVHGVFLLLLFLHIVGLGYVANMVLGAAGLTAFVIGFALKDIGENFLAGVIMAFDRPFRLGDVIKTGAVEGVITEMSLRDTHVKTFDGKDVYIPNGQIIKNPLYNYTIDGFMRQTFLIHVALDSDLTKVRAILLDTISNIPGVLQEGRTPIVAIDNIDKHAVIVRCQFWIDTTDARYSGVELKSLAQINSLQALEKAGVEIPVVKYIDQSN